MYVAPVLNVTGNPSMYPHQNTPEHVKMLQMLVYKSCHVSWAVFWVCLLSPVAISKRSDKNPIEIWDLIVTAATHTQSLLQLIRSGSELKVMFLAYNASRNNDGFNQRCCAHNQRRAENPCVTICWSYKEQDEEHEENIMDCLCSSPGQSVSFRISAFCDLQLIS